MQTLGAERHFLLILLIITLLLVLAIFYPFLTVFILGAAFAVILNPIYLWIKKNITKGISWISSTITIILFLLVLCTPLFFVGVVIVDQVQNANVYLSKLDNPSEIIKKLDIRISKAMPEGFSFNLQEKISDWLSYFSDNIDGLFTYTFRTILMFVLMILTIFYLLNNGDRWKKDLVNLLPISKKNAEEIFLKLGDAVNRILKGAFFIALAQGLLAGLGFTIFGVPNAALWAVLVGIASFIPTFGTSVINVPIIIYLILSGAYLPAIGLAIWSAIIVGTVDNILAPYVISRDSNISPFFILFSILGGVTLMGPIGILIGPLIVSFLFTLVPIYKKELKIE